MYYTGIDPRDMMPVYVARDPHEKALQRALLQWKRPELRGLVIEALEKAGRTDLIGYTPECLIRPQKGEKYFGKQPEQQPSGEKRRPGQHGGEGNLRREVHHGGRAEHRGGKRPDASRRNGGSVPGQKGKMSPAKKAAFAKKRKK